MTLWHHWGASWGWLQMLWMDGPHDCKTTLNINIYPSTLVFVENIGHNYDFEGGGGGWSRSKENNTFLLTVNV